MKSYIECDGDVATPPRAKAAHATASRAQPLTPHRRGTAAIIKNACMRTTPSRNTDIIFYDCCRKKIRIHLPQKVKHIHHHKKIYITNHAAASQYAPAYLPSAEGAMSVPTSVALPAGGGLMPVSSVEVFDEPVPRVPAASKLLPLYNTRGYYGPSAAEWDDQEYDLSPPPDLTDHSYPAIFSGPSAAAAPLAHYPQKKLKIVKLNETPRKKGVRKGKPKRVPPRPKPHLDEEIPVSTFHEQFYSDLNPSATLKKVKKPQRVEKIIDGDTEHIHTYSEEHVHKLVYDDGTSKLVGVEPAGSMSALNPSHQMFPIKNTLVALSPEALTGFASIGSMGTPSHLEYAAYNPRDVTHDHVFHDHGEIPSNADVSKENLPYPPRVSYNSQGIRIGGQGSKGHKNKFALQTYSKPTRPTAVNDYSYYENMYSPYARPRLPKPINPSSFYDPTSEAASEDYKPTPSFKLSGKLNIKSRNVPAQIPALYYGGKQAPDYRKQQSSAPSPFAISSTIVHDYKPKMYPNQAPGPFGLNKYRDPLQNFKDSSYLSNLDYDSFASASSKLYAPDNKLNQLLTYPSKRGKKKSISTQNIRIGGLDHQTTVDHLADSGLSTFLNDGLPTALDFGQNTPLDSVTSTPYTIRESSLVHPYYSAMAKKALNGGDQMQEEASNTNFQYVEAPTTEITMVATTNAPHDYFEQESTDPIPIESTEDSVETRPMHSTKDIIGNTSNVLKHTTQRYSEFEAKDYKSADRPAGSPRVRHRHSNGADLLPGNAGTRKYGDKI